MIAEDRSGLHRAAILEQERCLEPLGQCRDRVARGGGERDLAAGDDGDGMPGRQALRGIADGVRIGPEPRVEAPAFRRRQRRRNRCVDQVLR